MSSEDCPVRLQDEFEACYDKKIASIVQACKEDRLLTPHMIAKEEIKDSRAQTSPEILNQVVQMHQRKIFDMNVCSFLIVTIHILVYSGTLEHIHILHTVDTFMYILSLFSCHCNYCLCMSCQVVILVYLYFFITSCSLSLLLNLHIFIYLQKYFKVLNRMKQPSYV